MTTSVGESPPFKTMAEAIQAAIALLPDDIRKRYCCGHIWEEIERAANGTPDSVINGPVGNKPVKLYLAAYLVNIMVQGLYMELTFGKAVKEDIQQLSRAEANAVKATISVVLEFVQKRLNIPVSNPKTKVPSVQII